MNYTPRSWFHRLTRRVPGRQGPWRNRFTPSLERLEKRELLSINSLTVNPPPVTPVEGTATSSFTVASFTDTDTTVTAGNFTAVVNWGDGSAIQTIDSTDGLSGGSGSFAVVASHTFAEESSSRNISVTIVDSSHSSFTVGSSSTFTVADASLSNLTINNPGATEGVTFSGFTIATFTDSNTGAPASDFTATVTWGDGSSSAASVVATGTAGQFAVLASHTYAEEGAQNLSVQVLDTGGSSLSNNLTISVADAPLSNLTISNPHATEGVALANVTVATFTDANHSAPATDFTATVTWGDGTSSAASVVATATPGQFAVLASHTYAEEGTQTLSVQVHDVGGSSVSGNVTISVADAPLSNLTINNPHATEGVTFGGFTIATFTDANASALATDFTATVVWGDGVSSSTNVVATSTHGVFAVVASHIYTEEGTRTLSIQVLDKGGATLSNSATIAVADAPLTNLVINNPNATGGVDTGTFTVATFHDVNTAAPVSDFTATILWGDGSTTTVSGATGGIVAEGGGNFAVRSSHTFASGGPINVSVRVADVGGSSLSASSGFSVANPPPATPPSGINALIMQEVLLGLDMVIFFQATSALFPSVIDNISTQLSEGGMPIVDELLFVQAGKLAFPGLTQTVYGAVGNILANPTYSTPTGFLVGAATYNATFAYVNDLVSTGTPPSLPTGGLPFGGSM